MEVNLQELLESAKVEDVSGLKEIVEHMNRYLTMNEMLKSECWLSNNRISTSISHEDLLITKGNIPFYNVCIKTRGKTYEDMICYETLLNIICKWHKDECIRLIDGYKNKN